MEPKHLAVRQNALLAYSTSMIAVLYHPITVKMGQSLIIIKDIYIAQVRTGHKCAMSVRALRLDCYLKCSDKLLVN